jgi:3-hydroxyisobutyrate dehydrogenase
MIEPVLSALGSRVQWVGHAGMGSRLKLAANHWMITLVAALAETMHLCELMGVDQSQFVALLDGGPLGSTYAMDKLGEMDRHEYPAGFPVRLAVKDLGLVREVANESHVQMPLLNTVLERMEDISHTRGEDDLAAVFELGLPRDATAG